MENLSISRLKAKWEGIRFSTLDWWKSVTPKQGDQRAESRFETTAEASIRILGQTAANAVDARVVNMSPTGLSLTTPFIFPRQLLEVRVNARTVAGEVRYCKLCADGYQLGIRLHAALEREAL